ncbi:S49 family peptidase [bacterium]|nr:S49 family peptidase [bacterium]
MAKGTKNRGGQLLAAMLEEGWVMQQTSLEALFEIVGRWIESGKGTLLEDVPEIDAALFHRGEHVKGTLDGIRMGSVGVTSLIGPHVPRPVQGVSGGGPTSLESVGQDLQTLADDPLVKSIVLHIDSPGGAVSGVGELSALIRQISETKPVYAYAEGMMASGAYWVGSAAKEVVAAKTAMVGSIGALVTIQTNKRRAQAAGIDTYEFVSSVSPHKRSDPATEDGANKYQSWANDLGDVFVQAVAEHRGVTVDKVLADFGQGDVMIASKALAAGMIDRIGTLEGLIAELNGEGGANGVEVASPSARNDLGETNQIDTQETSGKVGTMDRKELEAKYPDLLNAVLDEGKALASADLEKVHAEALTKTAADAVTAEAARVASVLEAAPRVKAALAEADTDGIVTKALADPKMDANAVKVALFDAQESAREQALAKVAEDGKQMPVVAAAPSTEVVEEEEKAAVVGNMVAGANQGR